MVFQLRRADGSVDALLQRHADRRDGSTRPLGPGDFSIQGHGRMAQPAHRRRSTPPAWILTVPSADLRLEITPWLADQEMQVSYVYWEGAVKVEGRGRRSGRRATATWS